MIRSAVAGISVIRGATTLLLVLAVATLLAFIARSQPLLAPAAGNSIYSGHGCASCHGEAGQGGAGPALAGNPKLWNQEYVIDQILLGGGGMPAFHRQLSDLQLAAVASYVRQSWGNDLPAVDPHAVVGRRDEVAQGDAATTGGSQLFAWNCMVCHGVNGGGGVGPALAGNVNLRDVNWVVAQIQLGGGGMPPFAPILDSEEIAAVATYIRNAWGNGFGEVAVEHVRAQWDGLARVAGEREQATSAQGDQDADGGNGQAESASEELFASLGCAGCHSSEGAGGIGPPLDGNPALADASYVLTTIRDGRRGMPAFGSRLDEVGIARLSSYVRTAWSNDFGPVRPATDPGIPASLRQSQADPILTGPLQQSGAQLFSALGCAGCHSSEGAGGIGPPLDGNRALGDRRFVIDTIFTGGRQMPSFAELLTDQQVAALATHVRTAWGNDFGAVTVDEVTRLRPEFVTPGR